MREFKIISKPSKDEQKVAMESYDALATVSSCIALISILFLPFVFQKLTIMLFTLVFAGFIKFSS